MNRHLTNFATILCCTLMLGSVIAQDRGDWPMYRKDPQLTGRSSLVGRLAQAPRTLWKQRLGGRPTPDERAFLIDVNGDGKDELIRQSLSSIICQTTEGKQLWQTSKLRNPQINQIRDFAGDGTKGLLVTTTNSITADQIIVSGVTGKATKLYSRRNVFGGYERHGKLLGDVKGEQLCAWWSGDPIKRFGTDGMRGEGYLWSFENGLEKPRLRFRASEVGVIYAPLHLLADMNCDGKLDMVMISHEQIWVYDLDTGKKLMQSSWSPNIRTYWANIAAAPLTKGAHPSLLMINPMMPGVQVIDQDGKNTTRRWKKVIGSKEDQYQSQIRVNKGAADPFVDLDQDGKLEILVAVDNEHDDDKTHLVIFDARSGKRLFDEPDHQVITVDELDGQKPLEIIVKKADGVVQICHWHKQRLKSIVQLRDWTPLLRPAPAEGQLNRSVGARATGINMPFWRDDNDERAFLARNLDGVFAFQFDGQQIKPSRKVTRHEALNNLPRRAKPYSWDGSRLTVDGSETYRLPISLKYRPLPALTGRLGNRRCVIVRDFAGNLVQIAIDGKSRTTMLTDHPPTIGSALVDLDGDGYNELLTAQRSGKGPSHIVALSETGQVQLRIKPPVGATETELGPTGSMGTRGSAGRWIAVRYRIKNDNTRVTVYSGKTANQLWTRDFLGPSRQSSTSFVLHIPTSVHDYDKDGVDDLIASSENWYEVISGVDGRTVSPLKTITAAVPGHWGAYATPIVFSPTKNGDPLVLHNNAYALTLVTQVDGSPIWHFGLTRDTTHSSKSGVADLDGNGRLEIITARKDGQLIAYESLATDHVCPKCPKGTKLNERNHSGKIRWTSTVGAEPSDFATADLNGDRKEDLLVGTKDGRLVALTEIDEKCKILWERHFPSSVLAPTIVDLNNDGHLEILIATGNGELHCLGR